MLKKVMETNNNLEIYYPVDNFWIQRAKDQQIVALKPLNIQRSNLFKILNISMAF